MVNGRRRRYIAYGLVVESVLELPLPEPPDHLVAVDVEIRRGVVPETLFGAIWYGPRFEAREGELLLRVEGVGRYLVAEGLEITVDADPLADMDEMLGFLLGSAFGALLHQRGQVPLHASAVLTRAGGAVLFMGRRGVGKSTLVAGLVERGYRMLADDVSVVFSTDGRTMVHPGIPRIRLRADSLAMLQLGRLSPSSGRFRDGKHALYPGEAFRRSPAVVTTVYLPTPWDHTHVELRRQPRSKSFAHFAAHTYRRQFLVGRKACWKHFTLISKLADEVRTCRLLRPHNAGDIDELVGALEKDFLAGPYEGPVGGAGGALVGKSAPV
jgi:hypothetical protein